MCKYTGKLLAVPQSLYPTKASLNEALSHSLAQLPITDANQLTSILMTYHNTMLHTLEQEESNGNQENIAPHQASHNQ